MFSTADRELSGYATPCGMTGLTLHRHIRSEEIQARTCCGPLFSSAKPYSHTVLTWQVLGDADSIVASRAPPATASKLTFDKVENGTCIG